MAEARLGPLPGCRPSGSPRNGLPEALGRGYRYRGTPGWYPEAGRHLDEAAVMPDDSHRPGLPAHEARRRLERARYEARLAEYTRLMAQDPRRTQAEAAIAMGLSAATVKAYAAELRKRGGS